MLSFFLSLALSTMALSDPLDSLENCKHEQILHGKWAINRFFTMADGCLVQVTPIDKPNQVYREYLFDQMGRFAIFNSTQGSYETATSMKSYFLFPVVQTPSIKKISERIVEVTLATGEKAQFDSQDLFLFSLNGRGLQYKEEKIIHLNEGGGFEILSHEEVFVDAGWKIGDRSYRDPDKTSKVIYNGRSCWIQNSVLFVYKDSLTGQDLYQPALRWNATQLKSWFLENCP